MPDPPGIYGGGDGMKEIHAGRYPSRKAAEEYAQRLREAGKKAFPRAATVYDVIIPEREDGETTLPL